MAHASHCCSSKPPAGGEHPLQPTWWSDGEKARCFAAVRKSLVGTSRRWSAGSFRRVAAVGRGASVGEGTQLCLAISTMFAVPALPGTRRSGFHAAQCGELSLALLERTRSQVSAIQFEQVETAYSTTSRSCRPECSRLNSETPTTGRCSFGRAPSRAADCGCAAERREQEPCAQHSPSLPFSRWGVFRGGRLWVPPLLARSWRARLRRIARALSRFPRSCTRTCASSWSLGGGFHRTLRQEALAAPLQVVMCSQGARLRRRSTPR